jgi:hypothetical protein
MDKEKKYMTTDIFFYSFYFYNITYSIYIFIEKLLPLSWLDRNTNKEGYIYLFFNLFYFNTTYIS